MTDDEHPSTEEPTGEADEAGSAPVPDEPEEGVPQAAADAPSGEDAPADAPSGEDAPAEATPGEATPEEAIAPTAPGTAKPARPPGAPLPRVTTGRGAKPAAAAARRAASAAGARPPGTGAKPAGTSSTRPAGAGAADKATGPARGTQPATPTARSSDTTPKTPPKASPGRPLPKAGAKPGQRPPGGAGAARPGREPDARAQSLKGKEANRARRAREIEERKAAAAAAAKVRRRNITLGSVIGVVIVVLATVLIIKAAQGPKPVTVATTPIPTAQLDAMITPTVGPAGPEAAQVPSGTVLAPVNQRLTGQTVDGIQCNNTEQLSYHIHAHLAIFVNGQARQVPYGIGIPGAQASSANSTSVSPFVGGTKCYYWLHTHALDGIIHIESPTAKIYTLGNFFDEWGQSISMTQVGPVTGTVQVFYNGKQYTGNDPRSLPLNAHALIQLDVSVPPYGTSATETVAPETIDFGKL